MTYGPVNFHQNTLNCCERFLHFETEATRGALPRGKLANSGQLASQSNSTNIIKTRRAGSGLTFRHCSFWTCLLLPVVDFNPVRRDSGYGNKKEMQTIQSQRTMLRLYAPIKIGLCSSTRFRYSHRLLLMNLDYVFWLRRAQISSSFS